MFGMDATSLRLFAISRDVERKRAEQRQQQEQNRQQYLQQQQAEAAATAAAAAAAAATAATATAPQYPGLGPRILTAGTDSFTHFTLRNLRKSDPEYLSISDGVQGRWMKPTGVPFVEDVYTIEVSSGVYVPFDHYSLTVGNILQRYHGTSCGSTCNFIVNPQEDPCGLSSCNLCNICTHGFKLDGNVGATARRTGFDLRYRNGIYFSSVSGKANDYAAGTARTGTDGRTLRCMIVANVAAGRSYATNQTRLSPDKCPPPGYDSVMGEVGPVLNYDELVVYKEEATLPTHLVVYSLT